MLGSQILKAKEMTIKTNVTQKVVKTTQRKNETIYMNLLDILIEKSFVYHKLRLYGVGRQKGTVAAKESFINFTSK